ncbi:MAG: excalibur calcium-binding domain-containing protein [Ilumatobacteraceae bacterium]
MSGWSGNATVESGAGKGDALKRVFVVVALVALVACGDPSVAGVLSSGGQPIPNATLAVTVPVTTTVPSTTVPTTTVPATTVPTTTTVSPTTVPTTAETPSTTSTTITTTATTLLAAPDAAGGIGQLLAIDVLAFVNVENEHTGGYVRDLFDYPADLDGDGCDTRSEVLQVESITPAQVDPIGCTVVEGDWISPYDGMTSSNPGEFEIDHVVPLKEAWDSGAWAWNVPALVAYANDLSDQRGLRAVSVTTNRSKGDGDPSNWLPLGAAAVCPYIADWVEIKARWSLSMDQSEYGRIRNLLNGSCVGLLMAPLEPLHVSTASAPAAPPAVPPSVPPDTDVYYANCTEARAAGAAPIQIGEPGYRKALDRDNDGTACE